MFNRLLSFLLFVSLGLVGLNAQAQDQQTQDQGESQEVEGLLTEEETQEALGFIQSRLFEEIELGAQHINGDYHFMGKIGGTLLKDSGEAFSMSLPFAATITSDGRYDILLAVADIEGEIYEKPLPWYGKVTFVEVRTSTINEDLEMNGISWADVEVETVIGQLSDDWFYGADASLSTYTGTFKPESSAAVQKLHTGFAPFYSAAATLLWFPSDATKFKFRGGYENRGAGDVTVMYRDDNLSDGEGSFDNSTWFFGVEFEPGLQWKGKKLTAYGRYNFGTDAHINIDGQRVFTDRVRPDLQLGIRVIGVR